MQSTCETNAKNIPVHLFLKESVTNTSGGCGTELRIEKRQFSPEALHPVKEWLVHRNDFGSGVELWISLLQFQNLCTQDPCCALLRKCVRCDVPSILLQRSNHHCCASGNWAFASRCLCKNTKDRDTQCLIDCSICLIYIYIFMNWLIGSNAKMSPNTRLDSSVKASYSILPHPCTSSFPRLLLDSRQPQDTEKVPSFGRMCPGSHQNAPTSNYLCQQFHCESNVIQLLIWVNRSIL